MAIDIRREILQNLYENQLIENYDLVPFLKKECPDVTMEDIRRYLREMEENMVIDTLITIQIIVLHNYKRVCKDYDGKIQVRIKQPGILEIQEYYLTEQTKKVNQSLIRTNRSTRRINNTLKKTNIVGLVIAGVTGCFIAMQFFKGDAKDQQSTNTRLEHLEQISDSMLRVQRGIDSSLKIMAKDSLKNIHVLK
jgi:hypothetical protein